MPFLRHLDPPDIAAIESLSNMAAFDLLAFREVMSHPTLRDGISDDWAYVAATLHSVNDDNPGLVDTLLDPHSVTVERRAINLPRSGAVDLAIIRTGPGARRSMELLEHSVRSAEEFMGLPLPTNYVALLFENAVIGYSAGTNYGTHIAVRPEYDVDDGSHEAEYAGSIIAHEVAHYYWSGNRDWVDEGASDFMASIVENRRTGKQIDATNQPCPYAANIAELELLNLSENPYAFICNYSLGERFFLDLYRTMGAEQFNQSFRNLYLMSETEDYDDTYKGTSVGIEHLRNAFQYNTADIDTIVARWYDGTASWDVGPPDIRLVDPSLPAINGQIDQAYIAIGIDGPAVSEISAQGVSDWVYLTLNYSYRVIGRPLSRNLGDCRILQRWLYK